VLISERSVQSSFQQGRHKHKYFIVLFFIIDNHLVCLVINEGHVAQIARSAQRHVDDLSCHYVY